MAIRQYWLVEMCFLKIPWNICVHSCTHTHTRTCEDAFLMQFYIYCLSILMKLIQPAFVCIGPVESRMDDDHMQPCSICHRWRFHAILWHTVPYSPGRPVSDVEVVCSARWIFFGCVTSIRILKNFFFYKTYFWKCNCHVNWK